MPKELQSFIASSAKKSITRFINPIKVTFQNKDDFTETVFIVDTPGFGDTQGHEVDISNSIGIIRSVSKTNKVYPLVIFNKQNQGGRCEIMKEQISFYLGMIREMNGDNKGAFNFYFSHYDHQQDMT